MCGEYFSGNLLAAVVRDGSSKKAMFSPKYLLIFVWVSATIAADLELEILHNNDMHSRFEETSKLSGTCQNKAKNMCYGGFARVAHVVRQARDAAVRGKGPPVLYLNAGDTYTGTSWFTVHRWRIAAEFLNLLKPDAISLGNHEFDDGVQGLVPFINALEFPIVTANVDFSKEPDLAKTPLKPSVTLTVKGHKIGVIGYLTPETQIISQTENVIFEDEIAAITREAEKLHSEGVKTIIALGHSGFEMDKLIAGRVPLVDLVIGGHTNTFLYNGPQPDAEIPEGLYPTAVKQKSGKVVPVVQAYAYTKYLGKLRVVIGGDGAVKTFQGQPLLLNWTIPQDPDILEVLEKYRPAVTNLSRQIIGRSRVSLDANKCRQEECNFGNLITDAFVAYKSFYYGGSYWTDAPIAVENGGGIRNSIEGGNITRADLLGALPFDNAMNAVSLNGSALLEMLETSIRSNGETSRGEFLQFSGLRVVYDTSRPPGKRVVSAAARCAACSTPVYEEVDPRKEYRILVAQFLLNGGDGYSVLKKKSFKVERLDINDAEMVAWYLNKFNPVVPGLEGRIHDLNKPGGGNFVYVQGNSASKTTSYLSTILLFVIFTINRYLY